MSLLIIVPIGSKARLYTVNKDLYNLTVNCSPSEVKVFKVNEKETKKIEIKELEENHENKSVI